MVIEEVSHTERDVRIPVPPTTDAGKHRVNSTHPQIFDLHIHLQSSAIIYGNIIVPLCNNNFPLQGNSRLSSLLLQL